MVRRSRDLVVQTVRSQIAAAKAAHGYTWGQLSAALGECGIHLSPTNLMSKYSRCSFKTTELFVLLRLLDVQTIDLATLSIPGLSDGRAQLDSTHAK